MNTHYLAFDLGAESGRAMIGTLDDTGLLRIREVHRFPNRMTQAADGNLHWDIAALYAAMLSCLRQVTAEAGYNLTSLGIDAWGVDFGLLDASGNLLDNPLSYRNPGTTSPAIMEKFFSILPREKLYQLTGIQLLPINTIFQLYALQQQEYLPLQKAASLLFIPDIFNFLLTGVKRVEYTIATTSQLFDPFNFRWEKTLLQLLELPEAFFQPVISPCSYLGTTTEEIRRQTALQPTPVVAMASHDTAAAVAAVPAEDDDFAFISCGTWSLMGITAPAPIINEKSLRYNFTNEGGIFHTFRLLKNINGLWLLQRLQKDWPLIQGYSISHLLELARTAEGFTAIIDPDKRAFFNPLSLPNTVQDFCQKTGQKIPQEPGQFVKTVLLSLALAYRYTLEQLSDISQREIKRIHIIGGGSLNSLLCQYTANATRLPVLAGPAEASATGNILSQIAFWKRITDIGALREILSASFTIQTYYPETDDIKWESLLQTFKDLKQCNYEPVINH